MDFKVIFQETFLQDLEALVTPIAEKNSGAAIRIGELILTKAQALAVFPERYPRVRQRPGIRRFIVNRNIKVFYTINFATKVVTVLRCWDGRRGHDPNFTVQ